jgi:flagellar hook-associated protein 3 FlgL
MITPLSSLTAAAQSFLVGLSQIQKREQTAQQQLTTGLEINTVSDDPDQISNLLETRSQLAQTQQINTNLGLVTTEVNTAESTLQSSVSLVEQAETLGTEGASDTNTAATRTDLANSLGSILQQLVSNANTTVGGRYIFSGDSDQVAPYSIDLTQASPISAYQGAASTRQIQSPDGSQFSVALTAQDIFDSPNAQQNVFVSINNLRQALLNNDTTSITSSLADVESSDTFLNQQLAFYGNVQDQVSSATDYGQNYATQLQTQLSGIQDANEAESITNLTQAQTELQAALESEAQMPKTSLFDYLG